jgi:hypothetical protein
MRRFLITQFTASFRVFPALNPGTFTFSILMGNPVWGLRPIRSSRVLIENFPNPTKVMDSPLLRVEVTISVNASRARAVFDLDILALFAMALTNSDLFNVVLLEVMIWDDLVKPKQRMIFEKYLLVFFMFCNSLKSFSFLARVLLFSTIF